LVPQSAPQPAALNATAPVESPASVEPVAADVVSDSEPVEPKAEKTPKRKTRKVVTETVSLPENEPAVENIVPPTAEPAAEPELPRPVASSFQVEEEVGFTDGESPVAGPAAVEPPPAPPRKPKATAPAKTTPDEPAKLKSSTWDRPKFAPRFDRTEPAGEAPAARPTRPTSPAAPRFDGPADRPPAPRGYDRPERPPEREGRFDRGQDRPPNRFSEARAGYGAPAGDARPMRYTARPDDAMTQVWISMGEADGITTRDIVGCILGETGLPKNVVGQVNIAERHTLVSIPRQEARNILSALNQAQLRGRRIRAKISEF
jgi:hypothetical protein